MSIDFIGNGVPLPKLTLKEWADAIFKDHPLHDNPHLGHLNRVLINAIQRSEKDPFNWQTHAMPVPTVFVNKADSEKAYGIEKHSYSLWLLMKKDSSEIVLLDRIHEQRECIQGVVHAYANPGEKIDKAPELYVRAVLITFGAFNRGHYTDGVKFVVYGTLPDKPNPLKAIMASQPHYDNDDLDSDQVNQVGIDAANLIV